MGMERVLERKKQGGCDVTNGFGMGLEWVWNGQAATEKKIGTGAHLDSVVVLLLTDGQHNHTLTNQNGAKSGFEMYFAIDPSTVEAGRKYKYRIKKFKPPFQTYGFPFPFPCQARERVDYVQRPTQQPGQ